MKDFLYDILWENYVSKFIKKKGLEIIFLNIKSVFCKKKVYARNYEKNKSNVTHKTKNKKINIIILKENFSEKKYLYENI